MRTQYGIPQALLDALAKCLNGLDHCLQFIVTSDAGLFFLFCCQLATARCVSRGIAHTFGDVVYLLAYLLRLTASLRLSRLLPVSDFPFIP